MLKPGQGEPERTFAAATEGGVRLAVRLTPQAGRTGLDGVVRGSASSPAKRLG